MRGAVVAALLLLCVSGAVQAIYEDQAGQYDWLKQHVGRVKLARLGSKPSSRLYVASEQGVVAAVSPADGSLVWRRVLAEGDICSHLLVVGSRVVTLSDAGKQLLAWEAGTGAAAWAGVATSSEVAGGVDLAAVGGKAVALAAGSQVKAFSLATGHQLWTASLAGGKPRLFPAADSGLWAISLGGSSLAVAHIDGDGQVSQQSSLALAGAQLDAAQLQASEAGVVALSADGSKLCAAERGASALSCQRLAALLPAGTSTEGARLVPGACGTHAVLQVAGGAAILALGGSGGAPLVKFVAGATASGCFQGQEPAAAPLVALAAPSAAGLQVQVLAAADGSSVQQQSTVAALAPRRVDGQAVGVAALFAAPAQSSFRHLAVFGDDSLALVQQGQAAWVRHEELASVTDVLFTDLPAPTPENEAQWLASQPSLAETVQAQVLMLKVQAAQLLNLPLATPEEVAAVERYKAVTSDKLRPTRDPDGFRKQMVVLTAGGKVLALHSGDGRALWSLDFGPTAAPRKLALWRVPHDVQHDVEVVAFAVGAGSTSATIINAHTGAIQQTLTAQLEAADLLQLPHPAHDGTADQHVFALLPAAVGGEVRVLPDTQQARAAFAAARPSLSFWRVDEGTGTIRGLGFTDSWAVEERWSVVVAPAGGPHRILHVAAHARGEAVASPARVLGDGSLKFKYLNPNTLLVAVGSPGGSTGAQPRVTALLLDAVTGRVLVSQAHEGATGPVHAVLTENMAAYHFWSTEAHRWQMATLELFDASPTTLKVSDLAFAETNTSSSSWDAPPLDAGSQSFLCRLPVVGLSVTRSARGTTAKQVLLLTPAGQVYLLDRRFLDPRRPIIAPGQKPTPEQQAEGLPPYQPELPMSGTMFATLGHEVKRLRGVALEAAELESTMLMLAHGLDLFYTRLTPSKSFDMVPDDFPYALLVLIVVSLTIATLVLSVLQRRGVTKAKWQ